MILKPNVLRTTLSGGCFLLIASVVGCDSVGDKSTVDAAAPPAANAKPAATAPPGKQNGIPGLSPEGGSKPAIGEGGMNTAPQMPAGATAPQ